MERSDIAELESLRSQGIEVEGTVTAVDDDVTYAVTYRSPQDPDVTRAAWVWVSTSESNPPRRGERRTLLVARDQPTAYGEGDQLDYFGTIGLGVILLIAIGIAELVRARRSSTRVAMPIQRFAWEDPTRRSRGTSWWHATLGGLSGLWIRQEHGVLTVSNPLGISRRAWTLQLRSDGLHLTRRDGMRCHLAWDDPWSVADEAAWWSRGAMSRVWINHLREGRYQPLLLTGGAEERSIIRLQALTDHLRRTPHARGALDDPQRVDALAGALAHRVRRIGTSFRFPAVDRLITGRLGGQLHGRRLPLPPGAQPPSIDALVDEVMASLNVYDRGRVKRRWVERRAARWLRQTPWPFDLLAPAAPRPSRLVDRQGDRRARSSGLDA
jgi:hypothetical protein